MGQQAADIYLVDLLGALAERARDRRAYGVVDALGRWEQGRVRVSRLQIESGTRTVTQWFSPCGASKSD